MGKAEEYIKRNRIESMPGGHVCYMVSEEDALEAIRLAREENPEQKPSGLSGWICPKCGRPVSPFESTCQFCAGPMVPTCNESDKFQVK